MIWLTQQCKKPADTYRRNNDAQGLPWSRHPIIYDSAPFVSGPNRANLPAAIAASLIQSNFGSGNFELVTRMHPNEVVPGGSRKGSNLSFFYYESSVEKWHGPFDIIADGKPIANVTRF